MSDPHIKACGSPGRALQAVATRVRCCAAWEAAGRTTQTPPLPGLEGLRGWGRGTRGSGSRPRRPSSVHLYLVRAGRGPTALDVRAVLGAGETRHKLLRSASRAARLLQAGRRAHLGYPAFVHAPWMRELSSRIPPDWGSNVLSHSPAAPCPSPTLSGSPKVPGNPPDPVPPGQILGSSTSATRTKCYLCFSF